MCAVMPVESPEAVAEKLILKYCVFTPVYFIPGVTSGV